MVIGSPGPSRPKHRRAGVLCVLLMLVAHQAPAMAQADIEVSHKDGNEHDILDVGRARVATSLGELVTLTNSGLQAASSLMVTIDDTTNFALSSVPFSLGAGASDDMTVTCSPTIAGDLTATVTIDFAPPVASQVTFQVSCYAPALWIDETDPYDFGDQEAGTTSAGDAITIVNDSGGVLEVTAINFAGTNCGLFADSATLPIVMGDGTSSDVGVTFSPAARGGAGPCTMTFDDDSGVTDNDVALVGTGVGAVLDLNTSDLDFGDARVGRAVTSSFTIQNRGDVGFDLDINDITISGANPGDFGVDFTSGTIAPGGSQVVNVTFTPGAAGARSATIDVVAGEPTDQDGVVFVSGAGTEALLVPGSTSVGFGDVRINGGISNRSVNLNNPGEETVTVTSIALTGADAGDFSLQSAVPPPNITISAGGSSTVNMRCDPDSIGNKTTTLRVASDDDGASPDDVTLSCRGVRSYIAVSDAGPLDFGDVLVGSTGAVAFSVSNQNMSFATSLNATLSTSSPRFGTSITSISNLAPGNSAGFNVTCTPVAEGTVNGTLIITSDDPVTPTINISLTCEGVKPEITRVLPSSATLEFGDVEISTTSGARTVRLRNDGSSDLTISNVSRVGADRLQFAHVDPSPLPIVLAPGSSADWSVTCSPTSVGLEAASLRFNSDDSDENPLDVPLRCNGVDSLLNVTSPLVFGDVRVCENATADLVLTNDGGTALTVSGLTLSRSEYTIVSGPTLPFDIAPSASETFSLQFEPVSGGVADGTLTIVSTDPSSPRVVDLNATGVIAQLSIDADTHDFGQVRIDQAFPDRVFTITNAATADFMVSSVGFTAATSDFVIEAITALPVTLSPTQTAQFRVRATPDSTGDKNASVEILTDIPMAPCGMGTQTVMLDAEGVVPDGAPSPSRIDFGPWDVQAAPSTRTVTIMNTGTAPLEVSDVLILGADESRYTATSSAPPFTIPVSGTSTIEVTYTPVMVSADDDAILRIVTDAQSGTNMDVDLDGRGIDRMIVPSVTALNFPTTYRFPVDPPRQSFDIANAGEAPLSITMVDKTGGGARAFTLVDAPDDIAGNTNATVIVEFDPDSAGQFVAELVIRNDDDAQPMVQIELSGRGLIPDLVITPANLDLGRVEAGRTSRLSEVVPEILRLTNQAAQPVHVREIRVVDSTGMPTDEIRATNFEPGPLGANADLSVDFEVRLTNDGSQRFTLQVFTELDETPVALVNMDVEAVPVTNNYYQCSSGAGGSTTVWVLWFVITTLVARRRRRHQDQ